jgi:hypothetical protein
VQCSAVQYNTIPDILLSLKSISIRCPSAEKTSSGRLPVRTVTVLVSTVCTDSKYRQ